MSHEYIFEPHKKRKRKKRKIHTDDMWLRDNDVEWDSWPGFNPDPNV